MSEKLTNFSAENLVVQSSYSSANETGENGGNVTNEIAQIGAEAENVSRDGASLAARQIGGGDYYVKQADRAGQEAMEDAVRLSAESYASEVGAYKSSSVSKPVSPEAVKAFGESQVKSFVEEQKAETGSRVKKELEGLHTNVRVGKTVEQ